MSVGLFEPGIRSLELPGPGAAAHMSLHLQITMSKSHRTKEADNQGSPIFSTGGHVVRLCWRPVGVSRCGVVPSGEQASKGALRFGQRLFALFFQFFLDFSAIPQKS